MAIVLGFDIGSNSVGSAWVDLASGQITTGVSVFPAGVDEADDKRGDPKNAKRRSTRRARITLARRAERRRRLRRRLIAEGLLPADAAEFQRLLEKTDPWELRSKGLSESLTPHEFGRVLLHLAQRRGAVGFTADVGDAGKVKTAMTDLQLAMLARYGSEEVRCRQEQLRHNIRTLSQKKKRSEQEEADLEIAQEDLKSLCDGLLRDSSVSFGRFIADLRDQRRRPIASKDRRRKKRGPREWREPVRNKAGQFEFHADRGMIRDEFAKLWEAQKRLGGPLAEKLTDGLRKALDDDTRNARWRHKGLLFGQRMQTWDLGTLGRCVLEPSERCAPHADMYASRYLLAETVNNLKVIEGGRAARSLTPEERDKIKAFLSGPLGVAKAGKQKGEPKRTVSVTDLRELMGWGKATKTSQFRFNIESDEDRDINTDWFSREIIHGAVTVEKWKGLPDRVQEGINRAILKRDPDDETAAAKLKAGVMSWAGLSEAQADALVAAWKRRPRPDAKRLNMSRRAVRNLLVVMDRAAPWPDPEKPGQTRWLTQIEARKIIAGDKGFVDVTSGQPLGENARRRYATGAKGATARDRHYMRKHLLRKNGEVLYDPQGLPLHEPPPAPLISNPVVRKAIHEVRRHLIEYMTTFGRKPDEVYIELAREAKMGKVDADRLLFRNRLRSRIRNDIIADLNLGALTSTQQRAAVDRVILCVQQGGVCPLCGNQKVTRKITPRMAAQGDGCEVSHIVPRGSGGHNGLGNLVLGHLECNRDMSRRTPRQFWDATLEGGFDAGLRWVEGIFGAIERPKPSDLKSVTGDSLWSCYFTRRDDLAKIEQFKKNVTDIQDMTQRQEAATKYAARQVMAYLADALFEGQGLPERGGTRRIFASDGMWTSRLRREWGLFFDPHDVKAKGLPSKQEQERKEKDRGDHRHHAIDAVIIALSTEHVRRAWDARDRQAEVDGVNSADEERMANYRKLHRIDVPFKTREEFRETVRRAVYGDESSHRPVCHRPVKRKLIGALHEETLFGPVVDRDGKLTGNYTAKKSVLQLHPNHLRMPRPETRDESIERLAAQYQREQLLDEKTARKRARALVATPGFQPRLVDPPPEKSGLVRDLALRQRIRECLAGYPDVKTNKSGERAPINPDDFSHNEIKQAFEDGEIRHASGVPIRSVVLLRTMSDPVIIRRRRPDHASDRMLPDADPASQRTYVGGNNHHIEIRVASNKKGVEVWSGDVVSTYAAAQRKLARLRACRAAKLPTPGELRGLSRAERQRFKDTLREIEKAHPLVDRSDNAEKGGKFVMSLCEGEMLFMRHKVRPEEVGYFVVAKLDRPQSIVVVPHWDARAATERKDAGGKKVPDSKREHFAVVPSDLKDLAPPGHERALKVRVSPLGVIRNVAD